MSARMSTAAQRKLGYILVIGIAAAILIADAPSRAASKSSGPPGARVEELLTLVRKFNPELAAAALDSEEAIAKIVSAGALDDPMMNLTRDQAFGQSMFTVSQEFPLWGKLQLRTDVAAANAQAAKSRQGGVATQIEERVKVTFAQYYEADQAIRVMKEIHTLLHAVAETARSRYAQGLVNQSDAIRADLEESRLDTDLAMLQQSEETSKAKINALIAHPANAALAKPAALRRIPSVDTLPLATLVARAREHNPMLAAARAEIAAAEGERKLVERSWYPDVTVGVGGDKCQTCPDTSTQFVGTLGVKIPLQWGVREAQAGAAQAKKGAARLRLDAELLNIESDLRSALASLQRAERTGRLLRTTLSQQSEAAYNSTVASYQLGRGDLTSVLDSAQRRFQIQIEALKIETEAQTALAAIERLVGGSL